MRFFFVIGSIFFTILLSYCAFATAFKRESIAMPFLKLNLTVLASLILYTIPIVFPDEKYSKIVYSLYLAVLDWILYMTFEYVCVFTEQSNSLRKNRLFKMVLFDLAIIDGFSILMNPFAFHVFKLKAVYEGSVFSYWSIQYELFFYIHTFVCYLLALSIVLELVRKRLQSPKLYRKNYQILMLAFLITLVLNAFFVHSGKFTKINFSVFLYSILTILAFYFSFYIVPSEAEITTFAQITENQESGLLCFDADGKLIHANRMASLRSRDDKRIIEQIELFRNLNYDRITREIEFEVVPNGKYSLEKRLFLEIFRNIRDSKNRLVGSYIKFDDITDERKRLEEETYNSSHDSLTGLLNRKTFFKRMSDVIQNDSTTARMLLCTNIKNFKLINDLLGEHFGDELLKRQARQLMSLELNDVIVGRISGDKFAILMTKRDFNEKQATIDTQSLQDYIKGINFKIHVCVGVYEISDPYENVSQMYDKALLAIKNIQGDYDQSISFYDSGMIDRLSERKDITNEFLPALEERQFCMYLQPQIRSSDKKLMGAEALVRWNHPERGLIFPDAFVGILEDTGLLHRLDKYIWEEAAKKVAEWKTRGIDLYIAVNISAKDFYYLDLYRTFTELVEKYQISPANLKLEITETVLMHDIDLHKSVIDNLQEYGFHIEMDDFGSGYSSLNMLKDIRFDVVKIDMEFLRETENENRSKKILTSIIKMAKTLGITIVTEGVENDSQVNFLTEIGCDIFQGYYFSKPVTVFDFESKYLKDCPA